MTADTGRNQAFARKLSARDPHEHHRAATPLELLYDLVLVIAVAAAAAGLHHAINENHALQGIGVFLFLFWALWWPWMNFTWFASAYDNDDVVYRCLVFVQMIGALVTAVGIKQFADGELTPLPLVGYIIMRLGMISLWLRASWSDPSRADCARRYAAGIAVCQLLWLGVFLLAPREYFMLAGVPVMIAEMAVPAYAERDSRTTWHRHHIIERYGLLTIIVFGESLLSAANAIAAISKDSFWDGELWSVLIGGFLILFAMWWIYFGERYHSALDSLRGAFLWGYSHFFVFGSAAAVGACIAVAVDHATGKAEISSLVANGAVAVPAAIYLLAVWFAHDRTAALPGHSRWQLPAFALLTLATMFAPYGILLAGLVLALCLAIRIREDAAA